MLITWTMESHAHSPSNLDEGKDAMDYDESDGVACAQIAGRSKRGRSVQHQSSQ